MAPELASFQGCFSSGPSLGDPGPTHSKRCPYKHTLAGVSTHTAPQLFLSNRDGAHLPLKSSFPLEKEPREPRRRDLRGRKQRQLPISALGGHPPGLQNPAGTSPGTKEELPRLEAQRPAPAPGTSARAQHTQGSPRTQESPTRPCSHPWLLSGCGWTGTHCHTVTSTPTHLLRHRAGTQPAPRSTLRAPGKPGVRAPRISAARSPRSRWQLWGPRRRWGGGSGRLSHGHASVWVWALASAGGGATP